MFVQFRSSGAANSPIRQSFHALAGAFALCVALVLASTAQARLGLIIPCYGNTSAQYNNALAAADKVPVIVVINPDDGVGSSKINSVATFAAGIKARGGRVAGYINSFYAGETSSNLNKYMDRYKSWYGATDFFIDEVAEGEAGYYNTVNSKAVARGCKIVLNPGTTLPASYGAADVIINYETYYDGDQYTKRWINYPSQTWAPRAKFGAIVYGTPTAGLAPSVQHAIDGNWDWIYVTNRGGNDPFGASPSYMASLIELVAAANEPPHISTVSHSNVGQKFTISWPAKTGWRYEVECSLDLVNWTSAWPAGGTPQTPLQVTAAGTSAIAEAALPPNDGKVYFRVKIL